MFGATPTVPTPFACAATIPATCVPWNWLSTHGSGLPIPGPDGRNETELCPREQSTFDRLPGMPLSVKSTW